MPLPKLNVLQCIQTELLQQTQVTQQGQPILFRYEKLKPLLFPLCESSCKLYIFPVCAERRKCSAQTFPDFDSVRKRREITLPRFCPHGHQLLSIGWVQHVFFSCHQLPQSTILMVNRRLLEHEWDCQRRRLALPRV
jgi:hypothetical protein